MSKRTCSNPTKCPICKPKKTKAKRKKKAGPKMGAKMDPTYAWYAQEDWIKRRTRWMWRLAPEIKKMNAEQCQTCHYQNRCNRIPLDEKITADIAAGKECPDYKSIWKKILSDDKEHDWGF